MTERKIEINVPEFEIRLMIVCYSSIRDHTQGSDKNLNLMS